MNSIEQLVRDALASTPTPDISVADPVAAIERRARRARAIIVAGVTVAALIVAAAVVVPLSLVNRSAAPGDTTRIIQPAPLPTSRPPQVWFTGGSVAMRSGGGSLWHLHRTADTAKDQLQVDRVDPVTHQALATWDVQEPAGFIAYGLGMAWVWGGGDGGYPDGLLQAVNATGTKSWSNTHQAFNGVAFLAGQAWATTGRQVWKLDVSHGARTSSVIVLPAATTQNGIVVTESDELWVRMPKTWVRIDPTSDRIVDTVHWEGPMLGAAGANLIWTSDGSRLVAIAPSFLHRGQSLALTTTVVVPGLVEALAPSSDGGLFLVAVDGADPENDPSNLYYLSRRELAGSNPAIDGGTPEVADVSAYELAPDDRGGVSYTNTDGGTRWVP